jgi:hypothetical protein
MLRLTRPLVVLFFFILLMLISRDVQAETLRGTVLDSRTGVPVPGMKVILYHPAVREIRPQYTDRYGKFYFTFVPHQNGPYDLEFYWRDKLIFRDRIEIQGDMELPPYSL